MVLARRLFVLAATTTLLVHTASAQAAPVVLRGVAWDSLRSAPLPAAAITLTGGGARRLTTTDSRGRFSFDSVIPGQYLLQMQHAVLDTVGITGIQSRVTVAAGGADSRIAIPSFATIWKATCGDRQAPADSGIVLGSVDHAKDRRSADDAVVLLSWLALALDGRTLQQRRIRLETRTSSIGTYGVCGVPVDVSIRIVAGNDSAVSGAVDVSLAGLRVRSLDLLIASVSDSVTRGTVIGFISDTAGNPFPDARVRVDGAPEARSGADGRFRVTAPLGTRRIEVTALGVAPMESIVDIVALDTTEFVAQLKRVALLDVIRVSASREYRAFVNELDTRRKSGTGYVRDSLQVAGWGTMMSVFSSFPSTQVRMMGAGGVGDYVILFPGRMGGRCVANVWIDGWPAEHSELSMMRPDDFAVVEVYPRPASVPMKFQTGITECGVVAVWTKRGLPQ